jgi:hypothetical protein
VYFKARRLFVISIPLDMEVGASHLIIISLAKCTHTPSWVAAKKVDLQERSFGCGGTEKGLES